MLNMTAN